MHQDSRPAPPAARDHQPPGPGHRAGSWAGQVLAAAWASLDMPMTIVDEAFEVVLANPAARACLARHGTDVGDRLAVVGTSTTRTDGTPLTEASRPMRRALRGERVHDEEFAVASSDGSPPRRIVVSAYPFAGPDGEPLALGVWRDVTARWEAESARQATLDQLHQLMAGASDYAIMMLDPAGRVRTWSPPARRVMRFEEDAIVGQPLGRLFTEEDRRAGAPDEILRTALAEGRAVTEGLRLRGDGTTFWARGVVTAQRDERGALVGFVKVTHDITVEHLAKQTVLDLNRELEGRIAARTVELERQAEQLAEANHELEAFSYSVSHDLRAPLRAMGGFARVLADEHADRLDDEGLHYLGRIQVAAQQMAELIEGLLAFSRLQRQRIGDDPLDMTQLARAAWASVAPGHPPEELDLQPLPPHRGDRQLLAQVWVNLLDNAVKFTARVPARRIRVWAEADASGVAYCVADNGAGFAPELTDRLFTPFQRLHSGEEYPGTGIGLALVQRILRRHGGKISAHAAPGQGATFRFTLGEPR